MNDVVKSNAPVSYAEKAWQSDVIVDLIKHYGFPYIALNPGASYRGLHDSLVNYGGNQPPMLLCQHEKIAVQIAHGYAKATGKPMVAIVHDVVGMLHATMGIYYAYIDRCAGFRHRRHRADGREPPPAVHRLDPHRQCPGRAGAPLREMGLSAVAASRACRIPSPAPTRR